MLKWSKLYTMNYGGSMAKYEMIYKDILGKIENGTYQAKEMLPGEFELMEAYEASRDTIRKALSLLVQNGYIQKSKGRGSIVLDVNRYDFPVSGVVSFKELSTGLGSNVETEVICLEKTHPDARMKKILGLCDDDMLWIIQRVRKVDGEAIILDTDFINANVVPELSEEIVKNSLYEHIEGTLGLKIAYANKEITCQNANGMDQQLLDMKGYNMIVNVESYTYLEDTRMFQFTSSRHRPDKFRFKDFARRIKTV